MPVFVEYGRLRDLIRFDLRELKQCLYYVELRAHDRDIIERILRRMEERLE